jgi:hypothetical protein
LREQLKTSIAHTQHHRQVRDEEDQIDQIPLSRQDRVCHFELQSAIYWNVVLVV